MADISRKRQSVISPVQWLTLAIVAAFVAWSVAPASATIHPIQCSEVSSAPAGTPAATQNPPGLTSEGHEPGYTDPDPDNNVEAVARGDRSDS